MKSQIAFILLIITAALNLNSCGDNGNEDEPSISNPTNPSSNNEDKTNDFGISESQILNLLTHPDYGWLADDFVQYELHFEYPNKITYIEQSTYKMGNYSHAYLTASGTFVMNGNKLTANFTSVWWQYYSNSYWKNGNDSWFPDWERNGTKVVKYTILKLTKDELVITDDLGHKLYMDPQ